VIDGNGERPRRWEPPSPEQVAELKEKYHSDNFYELILGEDTFVVRPPTRGEYGKFRQAIHDEGKRPYALETLARDCILYPDREQVSALLEVWPALGEKIGNKVLELGRASDEIQIKKL
jgi:hypothetical protein